MLKWILAIFTSGVTYFVPVKFKKAVEFLLQAYSHHILFRLTPQIGQSLVNTASSAW